MSPEMKRKANTQLSKHYGLNVSERNKVMQNLKFSDKIDKSISN